MPNLKKHTGKTLIDRPRYEEAISDGKKEIDDLIKGKSSVAGGALGIGLAIVRALQAAKVRACASCGQAPAEVDDLCRPCNARPVLTTTTKKKK